MKTNNLPDDVDIRIVEAGDLPLYKCKFRKKGSLLWTYLKRYDWTSHKVCDTAYGNPYDFSYCREFDYARCVKNNEEAYMYLEQYQKEREKNKCIILK